MESMEMCIRDNLNKQINESVKEKLKYIKFYDIDKFYIRKDCKISLYEKCSNLKYILGFKEESLEFLEKIKFALRELDLNKLVYLCDTYEFRFFKVFDYIIEIGIIDNTNFREIWVLFKSLIKVCRTINGLNLSIFVLNILDKNILSELNTLGLYEDLNHIEVLGFLYKNETCCSNNLYFNLFKNSYKKFDIKMLDKLNKFEKFNSKAFIVHFYLSSIDNIDFEYFNITDFKILIEYLINFEKSLNKLSNKFLHEDKICEFTKMYKDLNFFVNHLKNVVDEKKLIENSYDIKFICLYLESFSSFRDFYLNEKILNFIFNKLVEFIEDRNFKDIYNIIGIYNNIDINISQNLIPLIVKNYSSCDFCEYIIRKFRNYKYFYEILNEIEKNVYLTKVLEKIEFRVLLLRSLSCFYAKNTYNMVGINFLKILMEDKSLYIENIDYINFIAQKILERRNY